MKFLYQIKTFLFIILTLVVLPASYAIPGPPFFTDDPEPVEFRHWEYYISSLSTFHPDAWSGTSPHFEVNYGIVPKVQIHLLLPINYTFTSNQRMHLGYADTEFGVKYCFVKESKNLPQIGTFPIAIIPTVRNAGFSDGKMQLFIPIWMQKSWNKITTYGGAGYWMRSGSNNKNSIFMGWEIQYDFSSRLTLGGEIYHHSVETIGGQSTTAFSVGGSFNATTKTHLIFSIGHSITHENFTSSYIGLLWTI